MAVRSRGPSVVWASEEGGQRTRGEKRRSAKMIARNQETQKQLTSMGEPQPKKAEKLTLARSERKEPCAECRP